MPKHLTRINVSYLVEVEAEDPKELAGRIDKCIPMVNLESQVRLLDQTIDYKYIGNTDKCCIPEGPDGNSLLH